MVNITQSAVPEVQYLLPVCLALCAVEVRSDEGNDKVTEQPPDPESQQPALSCHV